MVTAAEAIVDILATEKVPYAFGLSGSTIVPLLDRLAKSKTRFLTALHENIALGMADGYARATLRPTFVLLHSAPGLTSCLPNLYNAAMDRLPLILLIGDADERHQFDEPGLWMDHARSVLAPFTRWTWRVETAAEVPRALRRAIKVATSPASGPTALLIPENLFDTEVQYTRLAPARYRIPATSEGDAGALERAAQLLVQAARPVVVAGTEVARSGALAELVALCQALALPVVSESPYPFTQSLNFPHTHPLYLGIYRPELLRGLRPDVLLAAGARVFSERRYLAEPSIPRACRVIHVHRDPWELGRSYPVDAALLGDCKTILGKLGTRVGSLLRAESKARVQARGQRVRRLRQSFDSWRAKQAQRNGNKTPIRLTRLVQELWKALAPDTIIVDEGIVGSTYLDAYYPFSTSGTLVGRSAGALGWGASAALGVQLAYPKKRVACFIGDGAFMFAPQALWSATRYHLPVLFVVLNNTVYASVILSYGGRDKRPKTVSRPHLGVDLAPPTIDILGIARSFGVAGESVAKPNEIAPALKRAKAQPDPYVLDVHVDPSESVFRYPEHPGRLY
jgi:benzoylformate decarboxylase